MIELDEADVSCINIVSAFISCQQVSSLSACHPVDVLVLCGNAILPIPEIVFAALESRPDLAKVLVICGGIGHSTKFLYDAVQRNEKYSVLASQVTGLPESAVFELILRNFYPKLAERIENGELKLIIEDKSSNCGANAIETRRVLEQNDIPMPRSCIIVQDPTMSLRTLAAFEHTYQDVSPPPRFLACPTFVPKMYLDERNLYHLTANRNDTSFRSQDLWEIQRFLDLIMGEIPRLRDDKDGYGPKGKNFIVHVDVPRDVESAWEHLQRLLKSESLGRH